MGRLLLVSVLVIAACTPSTSQPSTTPPAASLTVATVPPATAAVDSRPTGLVDYTVSDCTTPPVSFALLCDVFELIQENHVDAPLDTAALAAGAAVGAEGHRPSLEGEPPDGFQCAIPDEAFESTCEVIASRLAAGSFEVEETIEEAVASMIGLSLDPFTYYIPPELSGALTEDGIVSAVGLLLTVVDPQGSVCTVIDGPCLLEVVMAVEGGPAFQAGIEAGDHVTSIDGEPVAGLSLVDVASLLDGAADTWVAVSVETSDGTSETIEVERQQHEPPGLVVEVPRSGVGYLRIPDFQADIPRFVHTALESLVLADVSELVVDLRDNPGGFVDVATLVASEFLDDGLVLRSMGPSGNLDYPVQPGGLATGGVDVTVVVNSGSASAAEIVAGVLQESGRATVVGTPTFGKNTVQIGFPLRNDGELRVTIARWTTPEGESVAIDGIEPDIVADIPAGASPGEVVDLALG